jgi:GTP-binding protein
VHFRARGGTNGQGSNCDGANADDLLVPVPAGTIIRKRCEPQPIHSSAAVAGGTSAAARCQRSGRGGEQRRQLHRS